MFTYEERSSVMSQLTNNNPPSSGFFTPLEIVKNNIQLQEARAKMPLLKMVLLGILAGMFIAGGAAASSVAMHAIKNVGLARFAGAAIFPVGLILIILVGGELFTGDCMMIFGILDKKVKAADLIRVLVVVWVSNLVGSVIFAYLVYASGQYHYTDGLLGAYTIKVALGKCNLSFGSALSSGILCNFFVCCAVLAAAAAKDTIGKIFGAFFPIMAFVLSGYEHCVANMYYIPAGIFAKGSADYVQAAADAYNISAEQLDSLNWGTFFLNSSLPVTLGNIIGGMLFVSAILYFVHKKSLN